MKKNILYVSPFSNMGGAELSIITIIRSLDPDIFSVRLVCYDDGPFIQKLADLGIEHIIFPRTNFVSNFVIIGKLFWYIRTHHIDLVHVNSLDIRAAFAARLAGVKLLGHLRVIIPFTWRDRLFVLLSNAMISVSDAAKHVLCKGISFAKKKFYMVPCAIKDPGKVTPVDLRKQFGLPADSLLIGLVGRIDPFKGHEVFIDAAINVMSVFPKAYFFIIGAPNPHIEAELEYLKHLQARIKASGLEDHFVLTGFMPNIMEVIAGLTLLVVPSLQLKTSRGLVCEGFGRVAAEAMAVEVPVIASNSGGLKEIVEHNKTGFLVPPGNTDALVEAILQILKDPQMSRVMVKAAKEKFTYLFGFQGIELVKQVYMRMFDLYHGKRTCALCKFRYFFIREYSSPGFTVLECALCGLTQVDPLPDAMQLENAYDQEYYEDWVTKQRARRVVMWQKRLKSVALSAPAKGRLLDVGCGEGLFLEVARENGWDVAGTEISPAGARLAAASLGEAIFCGALSDAHYPDASFDVVTLWHVLEHTTNPFEQLSEIRRILKPGGLLVVAVPNLENSLYRFIYRLVRGKKLRLFSVQDRELHLFHFSAETLKKMLEQADFSVECIRPDCGAVKISQQFLNILARGFFALTGKIRGEALEVFCRKKKV